MAQSASIEDVLFDQMEFLLAVKVSHGPDCECRDCLRFTRVRNVLMEPFGEKAESEAKVHQKKVKKAAG